LPGIRGVTSLTPADIPGAEDIGLKAARLGEWVGSLERIADELRGELERVLGQAAP